MGLTRTALLVLGVSVISGGLLGCGEVAEQGRRVPPNDGGTPNPVIRYPCNDPRPLGGGLFSCDRGFLHRANDETCTVSTPAAGATCNADSECRQDADCTNKVPCKSAPDGRCFCGYGCESDADCGGNVVCRCGATPGTGHCIHSDCRTDADCKGLLCTSAVAEPDNFPDQIFDVLFECQTPDDTCASDADCPGAHCFFYRGRRECLAWDGAISEVPGAMR